jgi:type IV pilus assembly protein PilB
MSEDIRHMRLGDLLLQAGVLDSQSLDAALVEQTKSRMRLGEILIKNDWLSEKQLAEALSRQLRLPMISLARYRPIPEAVRAVPEAIARRLEVVPLSIPAPGRVSVAMSDPLNVLAVDELRMMTNMDFDVSVATASDIRRALDTFYRVQTSLNEAIVEVMEEGRGEIDLVGAGAGASAVAADDAPVVRLVNGILEQAAREGASDIHIETFEKNSRVRYRIDGTLFDSLEFPRNLHAAVCSRIKIMAGMDISEKRRPQDGRILMKVTDRRIDLRISTLPAIYGEKVVARLLDQQNARVGLEKLGLEPGDRGLLEDIIKVPYGMVLVTGPTGSGKSTTLYSLLENLNTPEVNIITVEDPVEYTILGVNQVQVNEKAGVTFSETLRSILRQDPDKIMVGEIRDTETAQLAVRAALTGHLVLSTLHTNDAAGAIARLIDMGVPPFLVASSLVAVVAQRLVRRLCIHCRKEIAVPRPVARMLDVPEETRAWAPVGCDECRGTGYRGRVAVFEIMPLDEELRHLINEETPASRIRALAISKGMRTLASSAVRRMLDGTTSLEEMMSISMQ